MLPLIVLILSTISSLTYGQLSQPGCGLRPLYNEGDTKVISGVKAIPGDWAWSISMTNSGRHFCGGVLINSDTVVTAAHCFSGSSLINPAYRIEIGVHNRNNKETWVQTRSFRRLFVHEAFSMNTLKNDIALIRLNSPVTLDDKYFIPVCLDETTITPPELDPQSKVGWLTGWGHEKYGGVVTVEKMQGFIDTLTDTRCKQRYGALFDIPSQVCAGEDNANAGACQGDSGGPYVLQSSTDKKWYLIGLISWGYGCGAGTVFTRVKYFLPWITAKINLG